jgi:hypothetical protein
MKIHCHKVVIRNDGQIRSSMEVLFLGPLFSKGWLMNVYKEHFVSRTVCFCCPASEKIIFTCSQPLPLSDSITCSCYWTPALLRPGLDSIISLTDLLLNTAFIMLFQRNPDGLTESCPFFCMTALLPYQTADECPYLYETGHLVTSGLENWVLNWWSQVRKPAKLTQSEQTLLFFVSVLCPNLANSSDRRLRFAF